MAYNPGELHLLNRLMNYLEKIMVLKVHQLETGHYLFRDDFRRYDQPLAASSTEMN